MKSRVYFLAYHTWTCECLKIKTVFKRIASRTMVGYIYIQKYSKFQMQLEIQCFCIETGFLWIKNRCFWRSSEELHAHTTTIQCLKILTYLVKITHFAYLRILPLICILITITNVRENMRFGPVAPILVTSVYRTIHYRCCQ